jgi:folate-binding protein YgfZ
MSEAAEQAVLHKSPLDETHRRFGAQMKERDGWSLPASYGDAAAEYEAVRGGGAGLLDLSSHGLVEVSGNEAVQFLNGLITNDVKALDEGAWMLAAFPNVQGRLIAFARVLRHSGNLFLFDTEAATHRALFKTLERFTLAGDFHVRDRTGETVLLSVQGARAAQLIGATLGEEAARLERGRVHTAQWDGQRLSLIRATHTGEDGFDLFLDAEQAYGLWDALASGGAVGLGFDALETLRIEAGQPRYGIDMDESNVVLETGLDEAVSYTKGCYIGQEIIARIHWRGHVAKRLAGLIFEDTALVERDSRLRNAEGREIGRVTSSAFSPRLHQAIALAYVKYDYVAPGTEVLVLSGQEQQAREARVAELPFVRGGWSEAGAEQSV